jgi:hypothetical protein
VPSPWQSRGTSTQLGSQLLSASGAGTVRIWALRLDDLEAIAAAKLTRGFTTDECRTYLHVDRCPDTQP